MGATALLIVKMNTQWVSEPADFACIRFMKSTELCDEIDTVLGCMSVRLSTDDEVDLTFEALEISKAFKILRLRKYFGVGPFDSIERTAKVACSYRRLEPFKTYLH